MKRQIKFLRVFPLIILVSSCASSYQLINPRSVNYYGRVEDSGVIFEYKYNVLKESGNKKYAKRELRKDLQVVSMKITNNSSETISFAEDVEIHCSGRPIVPVDPEIVVAQLKQPVPIYLLYLLLWLTVSDCQNNECDVTPIPIGLPIGVGNMIVANNANFKFRAELQAANVLSKKIEPGKAAYGILSFKSTGYNPLTFKVK
ncbi:MAG: hypothetical protein AAF551_09625 [Bacteroidota bacterium]